MEEQEQKVFDFYIRAVKADRNWALWIKWYINSQGFTVFAEDFRPGEHPNIERNEIMPLARHVIVLFSPDAENDEHLYNDWIEVRASDPTGKLGKFIPIRVRQPQAGSSKQGRYPENIEDITLSGLNKDEAKNALHNGIHALQSVLHTKPIQTEPPFPGSDSIPDPVNPRSEPFSPRLLPLVGTSNVPTEQLSMMSQVDSKQPQPPVLLPDLVEKGTNSVNISMQSALFSPAWTELESPSAPKPHPTLQLDSVPQNPPKKDVVLPTISAPVPAPLSLPINLPQIPITGPTATPQPSMVTPQIPITGPTATPQISTPTMLSSMAGSADLSHHFISGSGTPTIQLKLQPQLQENYRKNMVWTPDGTYFVALEEHGIIRIWDRSLGWQTKTIQHPFDSANMTRALACSCDGDYLAFVSSSDQSIHIFDIQHGYIVTTAFEDYAEEITHLAWSQDGNYLASAAVDKTVRIWSIVDGKQEYLYECDEEPGLVTWSQDGQLAFVSGETIQICDQLQGCNFFKSQGQASFLAWSPDNLNIAAAVGSKIYVRYLYTKQEMIYSEHYSLVNNVVVNALAWSPNGAYIASADRSNLHIWRKDNATNCCTQRVGKKVHALLWPNNDEMLLIYADGSIDRGEVTF